MYSGEQQNQKLEEFIVSLKYGQAFAEAAFDEEGLALKVESILEGRNVELSATELAGVQDVLAAIELEARPLPLPEALRAFLLRMANKPEKKAGLIVTLLDESVQVIASAFYGLRLVEATATAVRSNAPSGHNRVVLSDAFQHTYEIIRQNAGEAQLRISFPEDARSGRVSLKRENRLLQTENLQGKEVVFDRLNQGSYELEFYQSSQLQKSIPLEIL